MHKLFLKTFSGNLEILSQEFAQSAPNRALKLPRQSELLRT